MTFHGLHGVMSQKRKIFITTAMRTPNLTTGKIIVLYILIFIFL
jgi:hypothetical protein